MRNIMNVKTLKKNSKDSLRLDNSSRRDKKLEKDTKRTGVTMISG